MRMPQLCRPESIEHTRTLMDFCSSWRRVFMLTAGALTRKQGLSVRMQVRVSDATSISTAKLFRI